MAKRGNDEQLPPNVIVVRQTTGLRVCRGGCNSGVQTTVLLRCGVWDVALITKVFILPFLLFILLLIILFFYLACSSVFWFRNCWPKLRHPHPHAYVLLWRRYTRVCETKIQSVNGSSIWCGTSLSFGFLFFVLFALGFCPENRFQQWKELVFSIVCNLYCLSSFCNTLLLGSFSSLGAHLVL